MAKPILNITLPLLFVIATAAQTYATIEVVTVTRENQQDAGLKCSLNAHKHPNGSDALLFTFEISAKQAERLRDQLLDASVALKDGDATSLHVPMRLTRTKDGAIRGEFTLSHRHLNAAWLTVHAYRKDAYCSGTLFSIKVAEFAKTKYTAIAQLQLLHSKVAPQQPLPQPELYTVKYYKGISHSFHGILVRGHSHGTDEHVPPSDGKFYHEFYFDKDERLVFNVAHPPNGDKYVTDYLLYKRGKPFARLSYSKNGLSYGNYVYYHREQPFLSCRILKDGKVVSIETLNKKTEPSQPTDSADSQARG